MDRFSPGLRINQVRTSVSIALLTSAALLAGVLAGCDSEQADVPRAKTSKASELGLDAEPTTEAVPACVPHDESHARVCGLAPPRRRVDGGTAHKLTTVDGESFWVVLPDELAPAAQLVAVPRVPIRIKADLTTARAREAAVRHCYGFPRCEPVAVDRDVVPSGVMTRWDDASGSIRDLAVATVDLGRWTLVMPEMDAAHGERFARALRWSVDDDGYPRLLSADLEARMLVYGPSVGLWVPKIEAPDEHALLEVVPDCDLSTQGTEPDIGRPDTGPELVPHSPESVAGGSWCLDGRYRIDVAFVERRQLERFHESVVIAASAAGQP